MYFPQKDIYIFMSSLMQVTMWEECLQIHKIHSTVNQYWMWWPVIFLENILGKGKSKFVRMQRGSTSTDCWVQLLSKSSLYEWGLIQRGQDGKMSLPFPRQFSASFSISMFFLKFEQHWKLVKFISIWSMHLWFIIINPKCNHGIPVEYLMSL